MVHVRSKYVVDILDYGKEKENFLPIIGFTTLLWKNETNYCKD